MKILKISITVLITLSFCLIQSKTIAQEDEQNPWWYVESHQVKWANIDSLYQLTVKYTLPAVEVAKKNGSILDCKILVHHTGDNYNVLKMVWFPSWSAMESGYSWWREAMEQIEPDEAKRNEIYDSYDWVMGDDTKHFDNIYEDFIYTAKKEAESN